MKFPVGLWYETIDFFLNGLVAAGFFLLSGCSDSSGKNDRPSDGNNNSPVANAGMDQTVTTGNMVILSGGGSTDGVGDPLTH